MRVVPFCGSFLLLAIGLFLGSLSANAALYPSLRFSGVPVKLPGFFDETRFASQSEISGPASCNLYLDRFSNEFKPRALWIRFNQNKDYVFVRWMPGTNHVRVAFRENGIGSVVTGTLEDLTQFPLLPIWRITYSYRSQEHVAVLNFGLVSFLNRKEDQINMVWSEDVTNSQGAYAHIFIAFTGYAHLNF